MVKIQKLSKPGKRSGFELPAGETTEVRGLTIVNNNRFSVYIDKQTAKRPKKK